MFVLFPLAPTLLFVKVALFRSNIDANVSLRWCLADSDPSARLDTFIGEGDILSMLMLICSLKHYGSGLL